MSWLEYHSQSERLAAEAEVAKLHGRLDEASRLYRIAAEYESRALGELDASKARTLGITAVSAVALWYKAHDLDQAERLAYRWLTSPLPAFAMEQLRDLVQRIWTQRAAERAGVKLAQGGRMTTDRLEDIRNLRDVIAKNPSSVAELDLVEAVSELLAEVDLLSRVASSRAASDTPGEPAKQRP